MGHSRPPPPPCRGLQGNFGLQMHGGRGLGPALSPRVEGTTVGRMLLGLADQGLDPQTQRGSGGPPLRVRAQAPHSTPCTRVFGTPALIAASLCLEGTWAGERWAGGWRGSP